MGIFVASNAVRGLMLWYSILLFNCGLQPMLWCDMITIMTSSSLLVLFYTVLPSTTSLPFRNTMPVGMDEASFIAPTASLVGDVKIGKGSCVWYGAIIRGDGNYIKIGEETSVGDGSIIHVATFTGDIAINIGNRVSIGPKTVIHACTIEDGAQIGSGSIVLNGAVVGRGSVLASGSLASPGKKIPAGELWAGTPARMIRKLNNEEKKALDVAIKDHIEHSRIHAAECAKSWEQVAMEEETADNVCEDDDDNSRERDTRGHLELIYMEDKESSPTLGRVFNHELRRDDEEMEEWVGKPHRPEEALPGKERPLHQVKK